MLGSRIAISDFVAWAPSPNSAFARLLAERVILFDAVGVKSAKRSPPRPLERVAK
jgi:hypothetical protein